jgi:hypothetical protein
MFKKMGIGLAASKSPRRQVVAHEVITKRSSEGYLQILLDKPLLDTNHRAATDLQGFPYCPAPCASGESRDLLPASASWEATSQGAGQRSSTAARH